MSKNIKFAYGARVLSFTFLMTVIVMVLMKEAIK